MPNNKERKKPENRQNYYESLTADCERRWLECKQKQPHLNMNTFEPFMNQFVERLVTWGVITAEQLLEFKIEQMEAIEDKIVEIEKALRERQSPQQSIAVPAEKKLIIPGRGQTH